MNSPISQYQLQNTTKKLPHNRFQYLQYAKQGDNEKDKISTYQIDCGSSLLHRQRGVCCHHHSSLVTGGAKDDWTPLLHLQYTINFSFTPSDFWHCRFSLLNYINRHWNDKSVWSNSSQFEIYIFLNNKLLFKKKQIEVLNVFFMFVLFCCNHCICFAICSIKHLSCWRL